MTPDNNKRKPARAKNTASSGRARKPPKDPARTPVVLDPGQSSPGARAEQPSSERDVKIRERAYLLFEACGCQHGHDLEHWLEAERQVATSEPADLGGSAGRSDEAGEASTSTSPAR